MVRAVASSPDRVVCVVGLAGAGKTTARRAVADAFRRDGITSRSAPPLRRRRREARRRDRHPRDTLHRLLAGAQQRSPSAASSSSTRPAMAETRILAPLLERVEHAQAKAS